MPISVSIGEYVDIGMSTLDGLQLYISSIDESVGHGGSVFVGDGVVDERGNKSGDVVWRGIWHL